MRGAQKRAAQRLQVDLALPERQREGAEGSQRRRFGRRGDAGIDHAGHHAEQQEHGPDHPKHPEFFDQRNRRRRWCARGILPGEEPDGRHDGDGHEDAGDDAADQQRADIHLRQQAVNDERDRWRDQHRQRARNRDHAGRHLRLVALLQHRGQAGRRQCRRRGRAGAADRAEAGAGKRGRHAKAAGYPAHPGGGRLEQIVRNTADQNELGHQQEHRDGDQFVGRHRRQRRGLQDAAQHRHAADQIKPENARARHRKAHRGADREQHEQHDHRQRENHSKVSPAACEAGRPITARPVTSERT